MIETPKTKIIKTLTTIYVKLFWIHFGIYCAVVGFFQTTRYRIYDLIADAKMIKLILSNYSPLVAIPHIYGYFVVKRALYKRFSL